MNNDRQLTISAAGSRKATHWPAQTLYWSDLVEKLRSAVRGTETLAEYLSLPKSKQDELKDVGGFVAGTLAGDRRKADNVTGRDVLTLDLDNIPAGHTADTLRRVEGLGCAYAVYSTRKHDENKPRLRILVPLNRIASADEYEPLARKLADIIGINLADPTTFEASRLMYWPSVCADSQYVFEYGDKPFLDADGVLGMYANWQDISQWPVVPGSENTHVRMAAKQGEPTEKKGVVGAFCREYDIYKAMDTFLPGVYTQTDDGSGRFTFIGGSTVGGAVIYENGSFLFSHHATDPVSGRLVNAFDLVRSHKFGEQDDDAKSGTPVNKLPSFVAMCAFALEDGGVASVINQERYDRVAQDFGMAATPENGSPDPDDVNWVSKLQISPTTGSPLKTSQNVLITLESDPQLRSKVRLDTFADSLIGQGPLPWAPREADTEPFMWLDDDDAGLRIYIERILGFRSKEGINDALVQCAARNRFNPVTDFLSSVVWDGVKRLDTLFIDYLGATDSVYTRSVTRKSFTAAVARAMNPGVKYDSMPVLAGAQGLGKTTLIQKMGRAWFSNSIESFEGKEAAELLQGVWLVEVGEMSAYSRSDVQVIKGFLSRTEDHYRAAYARRAEKHPRRCVFFGTSNRSDYLRDPTGGRRFWPVDVGVIPNTKSVFSDLDVEINQLWAEAVTYWRLGEPLFLTGDAAEEAKRQQESHSESDPREGIVKDFLERQVPVDWNNRSISDRLIYWGGEFGRTEGSMIDRDRVCAAEVWVECLKTDIKYMKRADSIAINNIIDGIEEWEKRKNPSRYGPYGKVKGGYSRK